MARTTVARVAAEALHQRLTRGEPVVVLDVRGRSYATSGRQIPGAVRIPPRELEAQLERLPAGVPVVAYCT